MSCKWQKELGSVFKFLAEKSQHVPHGRLNLKGERISSRLGNVLTVEEVLEMVKKKKPKKRLGSKTEDLNEIQKEFLIKDISLSALRISILKSKPGINIDFDFETSLNFEGALVHIFFTLMQEQILFWKKWKRGRRINCFLQFFTTL